MNNSRVIKILALVFLAVSIIIGIIIISNDPVEQVKKEQDERFQANAAEFIQSTVQYYSAQGGLPWFSTDDKGANCLDNQTKVPSMPLSLLTNCVRTLAEESSLSRDFLSTTTPDLLIVTNPNPQTGNSLDTIVCFQPQSRKWQNDPNTHYNLNGTNAAANRCISQGGPESCYWCTQ
jgi:hypothetical protein